MSVFENEYRVIRVPQHSKPFKGRKWVLSSNGSYVDGFHKKSEAVSRGRELGKQHSPAALVIEYEGGGIANKIEYK